MIDLLYDLATATAKAPTRAYDNDAAYDLYADEDAIVGGLSTMISTGVMLAIPPGYGGLLMGRSSVGKASVTPLGFVFEEGGLLRLGGCIDSGYRGPVKLMVARLSGATPYPVRRGEAIAQIWILPVPKSRLLRSGPGGLPPSERGRRGFGSSDRPAGLSDGEWAFLQRIRGVNGSPPPVHSAGYTVEPQPGAVAAGGIPVGVLGDVRAVRSHDDAGPLGPGEVRLLPPDPSNPGLMRVDPSSLPAEMRATMERALNVAHGVDAWAHGRLGAPPVAPTASPAVPTEEEARWLMRRIGMPDAWEQRVGTDAATSPTAPMAWSQPSPAPAIPLRELAPPPPPKREVGFGHRVMEDETPAAKQFSRPPSNSRERRSRGDDSEGGPVSPGAGHSHTVSGVIEPRAAMEPTSHATAPTSHGPPDPTPDGGEAPVGLVGVLGNLDSLLEASRTGDKLRGVADEVARIAWEEELPAANPDEWPKLLAERVERFLRERMSDSGA